MLHRWNLSATLAVLAVVLFCPRAAPAQDQRDYGPVTWDDFQGTPPENSPHDAETESGIEHNEYDFEGSFNSTTGKYEARPTNLKAKATMDKSGSWVKPDKKTDALLQHEQYHFDISEYYARKLQTALEGIVGTGDTPEAATADLDAKVEAKYNEVKAEHRATQDKYDEETDHGRNAEKQAEWCTKIAGWLKPPAPNQETGKSGNAPGQYTPQDRRFVLAGGAPLNSFSAPEGPFADPYLQGARLHLPPVFFSGYQMYYRDALFFPAAGIPPQAVLIANDGRVALRGDLRLLMGGGSATTSMTGWLEGVEIDPQALAQSPLLQGIQQELRARQGLVTLEIISPMPLEQATNFWTQPCQLPMQARLGAYVTWKRQRLQTLP